MFEQYLRHLKEEDCCVIALLDLARYVDASQGPDNPLAIIWERKGRTHDAYGEQFK